MLNSARNRGALLLLLLSALVLALYMAWRTDPDPPVPPAITGPVPANDRPIHTRTGRADDGVPIAAQDDPALANLSVRWCALLDAPRQLTRYPFGGATGETVDLPLECTGTAGGACVYPDLPEGIYKARQGPFQASGFLGWNDRGKDVELDLECVAACGAKILVHTKGACAAEGTLELWIGGDEPESEHPWGAGEAFELSDLPCRPKIGMVLRAEGCEPHEESLPFDELQANWEFSLSPAGYHWVQVVDAETSEPIQWARIRSPGLVYSEASDEQGWLGPMGLEGHTPSVAAPGYARRYISLQKLEEQLEIQVPLKPTHPVEVRCDDDGDTCPHGTWINTYAGNFYEDPPRRCCRLAGDWSCSCDVVRGEKVYARSGDRQSPKVTVQLDGPTQVVLPLALGELCLVWDTDQPGPCRLATVSLEEFSDPTAGSSGMHTARPFRPITIVTQANTDVMAVMACAEASWSGALTVAPLDESSCRKVQLQPHGTICGGHGSCTARTQPPLQEHYDFNGCSVPVPAWDYSVSCGDEHWELEVEPGSTAEFGD